MPGGITGAYARNARTHSPSQVALIAGSIREYGLTNPILADGANGIIAGHGRVMAQQSLGMTEVPVIELAHLSDSQKQAYILADNKLAEQAGWDRELLTLELGDLADFDVDIGCLGFDPREHDQLLNAAVPDPREEETPDAPLVPVSRQGDLWQLGSHRLICGDANDAGPVSRLLGGVRPHLLVTDPPFGVSYEYLARHSKSGIAHGMGKQANRKRAAVALHSQAAQSRSTPSAFSDT